MPPKKVLYFTNIAPHYRNRLWRTLAQVDEFEFHFYYGKTGKSGIEEINFQADDWAPHQGRIHLLQNIRLRDIIIWQRGVIRTCLLPENNTLIFLGQYHILSTWVAAFLSRLLGKRVLFWGHGFYGREKSIGRRIRHLFYSLAGEHLLYNHWAKKLMTDRRFAPDRLHVVYNSLDYDQHIRLRDRSILPGFYASSGFFEEPDLPTLIFIGRLTPIKRIDLLIEAVILLNTGAPRVNLVIVGAGPMREQLEKLAAPVKRQVHFYGACYDETTNSTLLANAELCVSPGDVGLSAIYSLSFGTPVCTHDDMTHQMPEAEAVRDGVTGILFRKNDSRDLSAKIDRWISQSRSRSETRRACYEIVDRFYNPDYQLSVFRKLLTTASSPVHCNDPA